MTVKPWFGTGSCFTETEQHLFHKTAKTLYKVINIIRFKKIRAEKHELFTLVVPRPINRTTSKTLLVVAFTVEFIACDVVLICSIDDGNCIAGCNVVFPADKQSLWAIAHSVFFLMHFRKSFLSLGAGKSSIQDLYCLKQTFCK